MVAVAGLLNLVEEHVLDLGGQLAQVAHQALVRVPQLIRVLMLPVMRQHLVRRRLIR